jgi:hypothetical protein
MDWQRYAWGRRRWRSSARALWPSLGAETLGNACAHAARGKKDASSVRQSIAAEHVLLRRGQRGALGVAERVLCPEAAPLCNRRPLAAQKPVDANVLVRLVRRHFRR